ncbi:MAG TPA: DUF969 domain-containing protein [Rhizomicrobium sp.]|jgi:uncharacterized membrane protein|nr:DUF969 domain-containing protein [Rhizomicrobium sp.]
MLVLSGIAIVVFGFLLRVNPLLVVAAAALVTGLAAGLHPLAVLAVLGKAFNENRYVSLVFLPLPVIGLLDRHGLQERARMLIMRLRGATAGRLLFAYLLFRQVLASLGLTAIGGHAQMVRPLIAPMAEAAATRATGHADAGTRARIRAFAASADNVGAFFGEDIFVAVSSILLIKGFLQQSGVIVQPFDLSLWAIPTALLALVIHGTRLLLLDRRHSAKSSATGGEPLT